MERLRIGVVRSRGLRGTDRIELLSNFGSGAIDDAVPMSKRPVAVWDGVDGVAEHLLSGHLASRHLDGVAPDGHLEEGHLLGEHLWPAAVLELTTPPLYFGAIAFAVRLRDAAGNAGTVSATVTRVANSAPRPATGLRAADVDKASGAIVFEFSASNDLDIE